MAGNLWDCIIVGGGPAGLTAAVYLARYRRNVVVFDNQNSRAMSIPLSHNYPGFPEGISGKVLLEKLHNQVFKYNVPVIYQTVESLQFLDKNNYIVSTEKDCFYAKKIILCTGVQDIELPFENIKEGVKKSLIRYCPVCDAYEVINKKIAVIGENKGGLDEAFFLSDYSNAVTFITLENTIPREKRIHQREINLVTEKIVNLTLYHNQIEVIFSDKTLRFDCIYSALGCANNNKLANDVQARQKNGRLMVNEKQQTSIQGLYAAGDIVSGLNQICVATSQAAVAATSVHKALSK